MPRVDNPHQAGQSKSHEQEELGPKLRSLYRTTESLILSIFSITTDYWEHPLNLELWFPKSYLTRWSLELSSIKQGSALICVVLLINCTKAHKYLLNISFPSHWYHLLIHMIKDKMQSTVTGRERCQWDNVFIALWSLKFEYPEARRTCLESVPAVVTSKWWELLQSPFHS